MRSGCIVLMFFAGGALSNMFRMILDGSPQRDNTENRHSVTIVAPPSQAPTLQQTIPLRVIMSSDIATTAETRAPYHLIKIQQLQSRVGTLHIVTRIIKKKEISKKKKKKKKKKIINEALSSQLYELL